MSSADRSGVVTYRVLFGVLTTLFGLASGVAGLVYHQHLAAPHPGCVSKSEWAVWSEAEQNIHAQFNRGVEQRLERLEMKVDAMMGLLKPN